LIEVYKVGNNPIQIGAGRLNGDDFADIVVLNRDSKNASVLINRGNGRFLPQQKTALGGTPVAMTLADLTGNGRSDLALLLAGSNKVAVRKFSGKKFGPAKIFNVGPNPKWLTVADVNDDVRLDIITTNAGNKTVSVLLHNGNNGFLPRQDHPTGFASTFVAAADIDGDGDLDIVAAKPSGSDVAVLENTLININPYP
jgi:hypothetical protein